MARFARATGDRFEDDCQFNVAFYKRRLSLGVTHAFHRRFAIHSSERREKKARFSFSSIEFGFHCNEHVLVANKQIRLESMGCREMKRTRATITLRFAVTTLQGANAIKVENKQILLFSTVTYLRREINEHSCAKQIHFSFAYFCCCCSCCCSRSRSFMRSHSMFQLRFQVEQVKSEKRN